MPLIINEDEGKKLGKKQVIVPDKLVNKLKLNKNLFGKYKKTKGFKRISAIVDDDYNKRSNKKDRIHNDNKTISFGDLKRIDHDMRHMSPNPHNLEYVLPGGDDMKNWAHDTLGKMRTAVKQVKAVPPVPKLEKNPLKTPDAQKDIKVGNASVRLTENIEYFYENYAYEYGESYVFSQFLEHPEGKQDWGVLINPEMYAKALRELSRFGKLTNSSFPSKYVYQWMGIIMKNTAMLIANTNIMGHSSNFPYEEYEDFVKSYYNDKKEVEVGMDNTRIELSPKDVYEMCGSIKEAADKYGQTYLPWVSQKEADELGSRHEREVMQRKFSQQYGDILDHISAYNEENDSEYGRDGIEIDEESMKIYWVINNFGFLDKVGLTDWMLMPDGSDAISDYGIDPIMRIIDEYDEDLEPEQVLVIVNKALDVYHQRGDLSSIFIQGGRSSLNRISEEISRNGKKITLTENQLLILKEYYNQTTFNFDKEGNAYFKKNNWQLYIDYLEEIGKYGTLPKSEWGYNEIVESIRAEQNIITPNESDIYESDYADMFAKLIYESLFEDDDVYDVFEPTVADMLTSFKNEENPTTYNELYNFLEDKDILEYTSEFEYMLTVYGSNKFQEMVNEAFTSEADDLADCLTINERGLVYIEREITIPKFDSPEFKSRRYKDYFKHLMDSYYGIGECFTWQKNKGEAYCGNHFEGGTTHVTLKCWVDPKDINWFETVYRNCYTLKDEAEIYINYTDAKIELFEVDINGRNALQHPIIVGP